MLSSHQKHGSASKGLSKASILNIYCYTSHSHLALLFNFPFLTQILNEIKTILWLVVNAGAFLKELMLLGLVIAGEGRGVPGPRPHLPAHRGIRPREGRLDLHSFNPFYKYIVKASEIDT